MRRIRPFEPKDQEFTIVDNVIFDLIMPSLSPNGWKVLCLILRKTRGWQKEWDGISYSQIKEGTGIKSDPTVSKALTELLDKNYVHQSIGDKWDAATYSLNTTLEIEVDNGPAIETKAETTIETKAEEAQKPAIETKDTKQSDSETKGKETNGGKPPAPAHDISPLLPDTNASRFLFGQLQAEARAKGRRLPKQFGSLACKDKFDKTAARLGFDETKAAIIRALEKGIIGCSGVTDFVAKWQPNGGKHGPNQRPGAGASRPGYRVAEPFDLAESERIKAEIHAGAAREGPEGAGGVP